MMTVKPLAGIVAGVMLAALLAPVPSTALVPRTVLVEETGWAT